jgi:hypothetical protein
MPTDLELHIGRRKTSVSVRPDLAWPGMWRVHHGDRVSDMVSLTRAKDAALSRAHRGPGEVAIWRYRQAPPEARSSAFEREAA